MSTSSGEERSQTPYPPGTYEEWLKTSRLSDWPNFDERTDTALELDSERNLLGTQDEIVEALRDHAPMPVYMLEELEDKLYLLQRRLNVYADQIVLEGDKSNRLQNNLFHSPSEGPFLYKKVMKKASQSNAVKAHRRQKRDMKKVLRTLILGSQARSLETMSFPGFNKNELTDLPHGLEAPQILNRVTKAQDFNSGFNKFWKKLFLSEASVAVMQDTFWWLFVVLYEPKRKDEEHKLFNRIADSFVALFMSVNPDIKDKFFAVYTDSLAQAIFAAYWEAFTDSHQQLDGDFKQSVATMCSEWIAGVTAPPMAWSHWNTKRLQPKSMNREKETDKKRVVLIKEGKVQKNADFSISVHLPVDEEALQAVGDSNAVPATGLSREPTMLTTTKSLRFNIPPPAAETEGATARVPVAPPPPRMPVESHQIGPGPEFDRVLFNIKGRSPLVAHYLYMKDLATNDKQGGRNVRRTEVSKLQEPAPTYREVIRETQKLSKDLNSEYKKITDELSKEMAAIEKQKLRQSREIEKLKGQIMHHNVDMKILSEKILDARGREGILAYLRETADDEERDLFKKGIASASSSEESYYEESSEEDA